MRHSLLEIVFLSFILEERTFLASSKHVSRDNFADGVLDASTNSKYWLDLFESKWPTNSSPEVQQFTTYISDIIADIKNQGIQYTHRFWDIL